MTPNGRKSIPEPKNCILCFTFSSSMNNLDDKLEDGVTISEVLKNVMCCSYQPLEKRYEFICYMCVSLLKLARDLKNNFENAKLNLQSCLSINKSIEPLVETTHNKLEEKCKNANDVEIIIGDMNYPLSDLVIVEEAENGTSNIDSVLNNLGNSISIEYVDVPNKPKSPLITDFSKNKINHIEYEEQVSINTIDNLAGDLETKYVCSYKNPEEIMIKIDDRSKQNIHIKKTVKPSKLTRKKSSRKKYQFSPKDYLIGAKKRRIPEYLQKKIDSLIAVENSSYSITNKPHTEDKTILNKPKNENSFIFNDNIFKVSYNCQHMCTKCSLIFSTKFKLQAHLYLAHDDKSVPESVIRSALKIKSINQSNENIIPTVEHNYSESDNDKLVCEHCGHISHSSGGAKYHSLTHIGKNYCCDQCGKKYFTPTHLNRHIRFYHNNESENHLCPICGVNRRTKPALNYHMKTHTRNNAYSCHMCNRSFLVKSALDVHIRRHKNDRKYLCNTCGYRFCTPSDLKKHEHTHFNIRPYTCTYCSKCFGSNYNLKVHLMSHKGNHNCLICNRGFVSDDILKLHLKLRHHIKELDPNKIIEENVDE